MVAAGSGERLGLGKPKAFAGLAGRPMVAWSLEALVVAGVPRAVVAVPPGQGDVPLDGEFPLGLAVVEGGATRSASVARGLAACGDVAAVVVHDAARPLVEPSLFGATLDALADADAAIAAAPVTDTIKEAGPDRLVERTLDRTRLWAIQTPQAFRAPVLRRALAVGEEELARATDDAWLVERMGGTVRIVEAAPSNLKVTTLHDLRIAELLLAGRRAERD